MPKDAAEIIIAARMCGAHYGDILTLNDGTRWRYTRGGLVPVQPPQ